MSMALIDSIPNETLQLICQELDDNELLTLCQVSARLHVLALDTFFLRHGMSERDIKAGQISLTSLSLRGAQLALFISSIKKLTCTFNHTSADSDISALVHFISRVSDIGRGIGEVDVALHCPPHLSSPTVRPRQILDLLFVVNRTMSGTLLVLDHSFMVSRHRRYVPLVELFWNVRTNGSISAIILISSAFLCMGVLGLYALLESIVTDPRARLHQSERIRKDVWWWNRPSLEIDSIRIKRPILPTSRLSKWTMITINNSSLTSLRIDHHPLLRNKWVDILPTVYLPALEYLKIRQNVNLEFSTFSAFVHRHPTIVSLELSSFAVLNASVPLPVNSLPNLTSLSASPCHIISILRSPEEFPNLRKVEIGPACQRVWRTFSSDLPDPKAKVEKPFNFEQLNDALALVANLRYPRISLHVQIPSGSYSKRWLTVTEGNQRVEQRVFNAAEVYLRTDNDQPLHPDLVPLLRGWFALFPNAGQVFISWYADPRHPPRDPLNGPVYRRF